MMAAVIGSMAEVSSERGFFWRGKWALFVGTFCSFVGTCKTLVGTSPTYLHGSRRAQGASV